MSSQGTFPFHHGINFEIKMCLNLLAEDLDISVKQISDIIHR